MAVGELYLQTEDKIEQTLNPDETKSISLKKGLENTAIKLKIIAEHNNGALISGKDIYNFLGNIIDTLELNIGTNKVFSFGANELLMIELNTKREFISKIDWSNGNGKKSYVTIDIPSVLLDGYLRPLDTAIPSRLYDEFSLNFKTKKLDGITNHTVTKVKVEIQQEGVIPEQFNRRVGVRAGEVVESGTSEIFMQEYKQTQQEQDADNSSFQVDIPNRINLAEAYIMVTDTATGELVRNIEEILTTVEYRNGANVYYKKDTEDLLNELKRSRLKTSTNPQYKGFIFLNFCLGKQSKTLDGRLVPKLDEAVLQFDLKTNKSVTIKVVFKTINNKGSVLSSDVKYPVKQIGA